LIHEYILTKNKAKGNLVYLTLLPFDWCPTPTIELGFKPISFGVIAQIFFIFFPHTNLSIPH